MVVFAVTFIVLALLGVLETAYLTWQHLHKDQHPLECPLQHDCSVVTESKWSKMFFVRNEVLGLVYYIGLLAGVIVHVVLPGMIPYASVLFVIATAGGLLFSLFLIGIQAFVIKDYCFYCLVSALIALLLFLNSFALV